MQRQLREVCAFEREREAGPEYGAGQPRQTLASPALGRKSLKNIGLKWRQIINLSGESTCLRPALDGC